jgi:hypothetical protein
MSCVEFTSRKEEGRASKRSIATNVGFPGPDYLFQWHIKNVPSKCLAMAVLFTNNGASRARRVGGSIGTRCCNKSRTVE